jgi:hypothetical protein
MAVAGAAPRARASTEAISETSTGAANAAMRFIEILLRGIDVSVMWLRLP